MEITINVTADKLADAIQALAASLSAVSIPAATVPAPVNEIQKKKTEKATPKEEPPFEPDPQPVPEVKAEKAPELTLIDLREKFQELQKKGLNVKEFLQANFSITKLPELTPEQFAEAIKLAEEAVS